MSLFVPARRGLYLCLTTSFGAFIALVPASATEPHFTSVAQEAGVSVYLSPMLDTPGRIMVGGGTVGDFDGDGWPDLFVPSTGNSPDHLFINNKGDGTFTDRATEWGLTDLYRGSGAAAGDYDRDGDLDLFVTNFGDTPGDPTVGHHRLYRNDGDSFSERAVAAGVNLSNPETSDGFSPVFGDYDLDGDLDLWVGGWHFPPFDRTFYGTRLFRNEGDGTFTDVTVEAGVYDTVVRGFSAIFVDMNGDLYPELLVAGDFATSRYFINNGDGTFISSFSTANSFLHPGSDMVENGMGTTVADFNRDGRARLVCHLDLALIPQFGRPWKPALHEHRQTTRSRCSRKRVGSMTAAGAGSHRSRLRPRRLGRYFPHQWVACHRHSHGS